MAFECAPGENLRDVAGRAGVAIYRSWHAFLNCKGKGKCGSCRIELADPASVQPAERTSAESRHLDRRFSDAGTRLACQIEICGDAVVRTQATKGGKRVETRSFIPRSF
ncbi:MAG: (2Fe-2S)-binding protein [Planctomycetes bacterium]|nr:(2Fe-2S)-binding protein [Planctomycetota bacterium]